jgi:hypothetical protein
MEFPLQFGNYLDKKYIIPTYRYLHIYYFPTEIPRSSTL